MIPKHNFVSRVLQKVEMFCRPSFQSLFPTTYFGKRNFRNGSNKCRYLFLKKAKHIHCLVNRIPSILPLNQVAMENLFVSPLWTLATSIVKTFSPAISQTSWPTLPSRQVWKQVDQIMGGGLMLG